MTTPPTSRVTEHLPDSIELFALCLLEVRTRNPFTLDACHAVAVREHAVVALDSKEGEGRKNQDNDDEQQDALMLAN